MYHHVPCAHEGSIQYLAEGDGIVDGIGRAVEPE